MERCAMHPDRETSYQCMKHGIYMCEECMHCKDPLIHCKFRTSCPIYFIQKNGKNLDKKAES